MLNLLKPQSLSMEDVKDYRYSTASGIFMPASKILIGTGGIISDASLYESGDLSFDFSNGVAENGLDTGVESSNQWYALYAVPKAGTKQYTLRASIQAPIQSGGTGPTGFPKHRYLGIFRNGPNTYSATSSHTPSDISLFTKTKNVMLFSPFNDTNGGLFPQTANYSGIILFVANSSTDTLFLDSNNPNYVGFSGNSPAGGAKLPYKFGRFGLAAYANTNSSGYISITDSAGNFRQAHPYTNSVVGVGNGLYFEHQPLTSGDWDGAIRSVISTNPNVNRGLNLRRFYDPFTIGGI